MKKAKSFTLYFFIYSFMICSLFLSTTLSIHASISTNVKVYINGELMEFGRDANDPGPYIKEGRTLIPFRRIFEALDMEVSWDAKERMVTAIGNDIEMKLYIGKTNAYVNGEEKTLDVPAEITDGR
ncbi:MAG TPA: copper amine oxidase N-terminal domain-containing protein, partial [Acetivibrio sp.]|nr:copper amine oxidase N-terminal domain-containing protein [Acetivibrio sp.]